MKKLILFSFLVHTPFLWANCSPFIGNPRLSDSCLVRSLDGAVLSESQYEVILAQLASHGAYYDTSRPRYYSSQSLNISSYWDNTVNGGNPLSHMTLGDITLQGDPSLTKVGDIVGGFSYNWYSDFVFNEQSWFDLNYQHNYGVGLTTGHEINFTKVTFCSNLKLYNSFFLDGCYFDSTEHKTLSVNSNANKEVKLSYLLNGAKLVSFGKVADLISSTHNFVEVSQALTNGNLLDARITSSKDEGGWSANLGYGFFSSGTAYKVNFSWNDYGRSWILGYPKEQVVKAIGLSLKTPSGYDLFIQYDRSSSNIDFFQNSNVNVSFGSAINLF